MKKKRSNEKGFTLIEMLVVLMIISVLLLIALPNMSKNTDMAGDKSCEATRKLVQTQVAAYEVEHGSIPQSIDVLIEEGYIDQVSCASGKRIVLNGKTVSISQ
ncbi:late competence protein ComGC, access of DNA to ComEA [Bacillus sp. JCM 19046]|uniref:ComG operon protein 3 n=1 Tax=Shouchella xiaoxiensis TaxID=766895 RepID=A0ABS2SXT5_9BACI|nr:competence type IV pilus major pilin ComGC [Shouchella xiaoxiensis]MBM7840340.1 competence protein ComGC [Shouchella xiaoxiensis]GAF13635.1 late competence protein ComGC, access of DNA to ComEA [Bacillus sp. JCM 19045]GAF16616.1 late competence protein ComGC, access of DNA to ComEA [Bacillus sp. JCM 19046]